MQYRILGPLQVIADDGEVRVGSSKERTLLAVLLLQASSVVSRERLIDELWGESPPPTAARALNTHVSQLRKTLARGGRDPIATRPRGYAIEVDPRDLDAALFEQLVAAARERVTAGDLGAASARLDESLALWRGLALADVELEAGARNEVARLEELRVAAQTERIDCELALGRHERVVPELERLLAEHPLRERVRSQLMLALYRSGRQAEALRVYREGRERLVAELGIEPSVPLQRLHRSILEQDPALESPAGVVHTEREVRASADSPLTIVFADGAGILRIARDFPPGSFEPFLNDFLRLLEHVFAEHGGRHLATFFDNVAAAFGSAESAVRAADAARRAVARFQPSLKLKVAVASTQGGDTWSREPEQRAALLCQTAVAGQILLTGEVRELLEREGAAAASLRDLGDRSLGAGGESVRVFELLG